MRVLIVTWVFPTHGGVFNFLEKVISGLSGGEHEFEVVAVEPSPEARRECNYLPEHQIHTVSQVALPSPLSFPLIGMILTVVGIARRGNFDVIFCQDPMFAGIPSLIASGITGIPLLVADHGLVKNFKKEEYWRNFGFQLIIIWRIISLMVMKPVFKISSGIYAPGEDVANAVRGLFGRELTGKITVFPIGIDTERYQPEADLGSEIRRGLSIKKGPVATFVGRLHIESGLDTLIEAASGFDEDTLPIFLIVGDGNLKTGYERLAREKSGGNFIFLGYREDVNPYLAASDIFVFPKIFAGGHSVALREAMAASLPCIATSGVDSHDEIIDDGKNGILVSPGASWELHKALKDLLDNPSLRAKLGTAARNYVIERYGMKIFLDNVKRLLSSLEER